jgi:hypothetical protein
MDEGAMEGGGNLIGAVGQIHKVRNVPVMQVVDQLLLQQRLPSAVSTGEVVTVQDAARVCCRDERKRGIWRRGWKVWQIYLFQIERIEGDVEAAAAQLIMHGDHSATR